MEGIIEFSNVKQVNLKTSRAVGYSTELLKMALKDPFGVYINPLMPKDIVLKSDTMQYLLKMDEEILAMERDYIIDSIANINDFTEDNNVRGKHTPFNLYLDEGLNPSSLPKLFKSVKYLNGSIEVLTL